MGPIYSASARALGLLTLCAALVAACSSNEPAANPDAGDTDTGVVNDLGVADNGVVDTGTPDRPDAPAGCRADADCTGNAAGLRVCNAATGACVACLPANDTCPSDQHCVAGMNVCAAGCRNDDGCRGAPAGDAGAPDGGTGGDRARCNAATNTCVQCVIDDHCPAGTRCAGNLCVPGCDAMRACPTGLTCCDGGCVDTARNTASCGACGTTCSAANAEPACFGGVCGVARCTAPFGDCDSVATNGCETNTLSNVAHCGGCGVACPSRSNATATCAAGTCGFTCDAGFADCDGNAGNGCEVELATTPAHCGACNSACTAAAGTPGCAAGACTVASCDTGFGNCDGNAANGCETNLGSSTAHCGACNNACPAPAGGAAVCASGSCGLGACTAGFANCDAADGNGCEIDTRTTLAHCGGCGQSCAPANAAGACSAGACTVASCNAGFANCDGVASNGCEVNLQSDLRHCGACNNACPTPSSGSAVCTAGACGIGTCNTGFGDCDGNAGNGCEVDTRTSTGNCGNCNNACSARPNAAASCASSTCGLGACNAGFANCDGDASNGCEVNLQTTLAHCGACNRGCAFANGSAACTTGTCALDGCNAGFSDCNATASDGCEVNTAATVTSCGACGRTCSFANAATSCAAGACVFGACNAGFGDCNSSSTDGCETPLNSDPRNCGACGRTCASGSVCVAGACQFGGGTEDRVVSTAVVLDPARAAARGSLGAFQLTVSSQVGSFSVGQTVVIHQTQASGATAGRYEINRVTAVGTGTINLATALSGDYTLAGTDRAQVMVVTELRSLTVTAAGSLAGPAWNGTHGGILALDVAGAVNVAGSVSMAARGFRSQGHACLQHCMRGFQGEGSTGVGAMNITRNGSGGGGGGAGQDDGSGGGGAYATPGEDGVYITANVCGSCAESCPIPHGQGGSAVGGTNLSASVLFGGAGGEGGTDEDGGSPGAGGFGGGAIILRAGTIAVTGTITGSGGAGGRGGNACGGGGCGMGGGGGGAGGAIRLVAATSVTLGTDLVVARGGTSANATCDRARSGVGGVGRVSVLSPALTGTTSPTLVRE